MLEKFYREAKLREDIKHGVGFDVKFDVKEEDSQEMITEAVDRERGITFKIGDRIRGRTQEDLQRQYGDSWISRTCMSNDIMFKDFFGVEYTIEAFHRNSGGDILIVDKNRYRLTGKKTGRDWAIYIQAFELVEQKEPAPEPTPPKAKITADRYKEKGKDSLKVESVLDCLMIIAAMRECGSGNCEECVAKMFDDDCNDAEREAHSFLEHNIGIDIEDDFRWSSVPPIVEALLKELAPEPDPKEPSFAKVVIGSPNSAPCICEECEHHEPLNGYDFCKYWHNFTKKNGFCNFATPKKKEEGEAKEND